MVACARPTARKGSNMRRHLLVHSLISFPCGVVIGLGIVGWLKLHPVDSVSASSSNGTRVLSAEATPNSARTLDLQTPQPSPVANGLEVISQDKSLKTSSSASLFPTQTPSTTRAQPVVSAIPSAADFKVYESYRDKSDSLYGDIAPGTGAPIAAGSKVTVAYRGWLTDGTLFDQSSDHNGSFSFTEGAHQVIAGWEDALIGLKVGGKRRVIVPPVVGYGNVEHSGIPASSVLVFDIELLAVK